MEQWQDKDEGFCNTCSVPTYLDTEYNFLQMYMSLEEEQRFRIGHNFSGLLKSCTFRGRDCNDERLATISFLNNF